MSQTPVFSPFFSDLETLKNKVREVSGTAPVFERLAFYMDRHWNDIVFMTANELADAVGVSQGSVTRFCNALGCHGYNSFQHALRTFSRQVPPSEHLPVSAGEDHVAAAVEQERSGIAELCKVFASEDYSTLIRQLNQAQRIFLLSSRLSGTLLPYLAYNLGRLGKDVSIIDADDCRWESLELLRRDHTLVLAAMFYPYAHNLIFKLERLKEKHIPVVGVTDSRLSPLNGLCQPVFYMPMASEHPFGQYSIPTFFFGVMLQDLARSDPHYEEFLKDLDVIKDETYVIHRFKK